MRNPARLSLRPGHGVARPWQVLHLPRLIPALNALLAVILFPPIASGQPTFHEIEPNDTPQDFGRVAGEVFLSGAMVGADQDGYLWAVSDNDARMRWTFELQGIPGALTITDVVRIEYADNGVDVVGKHGLMKMGTRDGSKPSVHEGLIFEPGEYVLGLASMGSHGQTGTAGAYRPPLSGLSFAADEPSSGEDTAASEEEIGANPGAYRFLIQKGRSFASLSPGRGPGETREEAYAMRLGSEYATFVSQESAWYSFAFPESEEHSRWDIRVQVPVGRRLQATLYDAEGKELASGRVDDKGRMRFPHLAPPAGTWYLELEAREPGFFQVVSSESVGQRAEGEEAEPNGKWPLANRIDFSQPLTGRIGGDDSSDYFFFDLDESSADQLLALRIETEPPTNLRLCLATEARTNVQCKDGTSPLELPDLLLTPGTWGFSIARASEATYSISLQGQGPVKAGFETEPNDSIQFPSGVPSNLRVKGRFSGTETDVYQVLVPGEPQLWRFQVIGDGVYEIRHYDGTGRLNASIRPLGERRIRLDNLFLLPGRHYLSVYGKDGGSYTLLARALGPPDPNGEMEPNDESNKQRLTIGQTRTGLLSEKNDSDYYRFFVGNWDHLKLTIEPPADGVVAPDLYWYSALIGQGQPAGPGEPLVMEGLFPPGDYWMKLKPRQISDAEYTLSLERLPRFSLPSDAEPNGYGKMYLAAPLPPDLALTGTTGEWRDWDYYQLPSFDQPTEVLLLSADPVTNVSVGPSYRARERLAHDPELGGYRATIPAGEPYRVMIDSKKKPYHLQLEFPGGELLPVTGDLPAELSLELEQEAVSAFRTNGQRLDGLLRVRNQGSTPLQVALEAVTSDYRWSVSLDQTEVSLIAGSQVEVPVTVLAPADAWADLAVRISARATGESGAQAETWQEIEVQREIPPVAPYLHWSIPETLRGGFNVAWVPFGGEWTEDTPEAVRNYSILRDGLVFPNSVAYCCKGWSTQEKDRLWTLDLPGDEPLPVAGLAINHFGASHENPFPNVRRATLMLSLDGTSFEEVLTFETLALHTEQHFALPRPMPARYARLRTEQSFEENPTKANASEWKVILEPGFDLSGGKGYNIANAELGGHVAWDWPPRPYLPGGIVKEDGSTGRAHLAKSSTRDYVLGFNQNRAAQITRIEWTYAEGTNETGRSFGSVAVSASLESSVGPWLPLGEIDLSGARQEGSLRLDEPTWARFIRFSARRLPDTPGPYQPDVIRIWERPTDDEYRSVLTEWGDLSTRAYYELQAGLEPEATLKPVDNDARERAARLTLSELASGQVSLGKQDHWYRLEMPPGDNTLTFELHGDPTVRTELALENSAGEAIAFKHITSKEKPSLHVMEAIVEPGSEVWLRVSEPPRNVVFTWDTSASVGAYIHQINNALVAFSGQVVPGREAVNLMPFANSMLLEEWYGEPYMLQTTLNDYRRVGSSSAAHRTIKLAARALAPLPGTKAMIVISDAESPNDGEMWQPMQEVRPRIFGVGVGGSQRYSHDLFRDWGAVNGGHFTQLRYEGEMEVAFDRITTLLHRPAGYTLLAQTEFREAPGPGLLSVVRGGGDGSGAGAGGAAVELILDASGSMLQRIEGKRRIVVAKEVLTEAVREHIPSGTPVALRVFGHKEVDSCRTDLEIPLGPLDPQAAAAKIAGINAMNLARTPIADSLAAVEGDLMGSKSGVVVLVTDGEETCEGDPAAAIEALRKKGFEVSLNIVGFAIDDPELAAQFASWAELGGGRYFAAHDQAGLSEAIEKALQLHYVVYDQGGNEVLQGEVGGDPVELEQGIYRVVVRSVPERVFDRIEVVGEESVTLKLD